MNDERPSLTLTWPGRAGAESNRLAISQRLLLLAGGGALLTLLACLVLAAVSAHLHQTTAALYARCAALEAERTALTERVQAAETEIHSARLGLARVRDEEAKIRSWMGLEQRGENTASLMPAERAVGGQGSLGEEGLEAVAPLARDEEAESVGILEMGSIVDQSQALATDLADLALHVQRQREFWDSVPAITPVDGEHWISSAFGWRNSPFTGKREFHNGIDMAGRTGTPIVAPAHGTVDKVFNDSALGKGLSIDHGNGLRSIYGHLAQVLVQPGQQVHRGEQVGKMGSSGKRSTGPHLHYAVKMDGRYVNPKNYMLEPNRLPFQTARR